MFCLSFIYINTVWEFDAMFFYECKHPGSVTKKVWKKIYCVLFRQNEFFLLTFSGCLDALEPFCQISHSINVKRKKKKCLIFRCRVGMKYLCIINLLNWVHVKIIRLLKIMRNMEKLFTHNTFCHCMLGRPLQLGMKDKSVYKKSVLEFLMKS